MGPSHVSDLKIEGGGKTQTFHSDVEADSNYHQQNGGMPMIGGQPALPPIFMPIKKGQKKKDGGGVTRLA